MSSVEGGWGGVSVQWEKTGVPHPKNKNDWFRKQPQHRTRLLLSKICWESLHSPHLFLMAATSSCYFGYGKKAVSSGYLL